LTACKCENTFREDDVIVCANRLYPKADLPACNTLKMTCLPATMKRTRKVHASTGCTPSVTWLFVTTECTLKMTCLFVYTGYGPKMAEPEGCTLIMT